MKLLKSLPRSIVVFTKVWKDQYKTFYAYIFVFNEEIKQLFDLKVYAYISVGGVKRGIPHNRLWPGDVNLQVN